MRNQQLILRVVLTILMCNASFLKPSIAQARSTHNMLPAQSSITPGMTSAFSTYLETAEFSSTLLLVNASSASSSIELSLRSDQGLVLLKERVQVPALTQVRIRLADLLQQHGVLSERGSVLLRRPDPGSSAVTGVLSIAQKTEQGMQYVVEKSALLLPDSSRFLRSAIGVLRDSPTIRVTSISRTPQVISVTCFSEHGALQSIIQLKADSTETVRPCTSVEIDDQRSHDGNAMNRLDRTYGIALSSDKGGGSFAAFGLGVRGTSEDEHLTGLIFDDPALLQSSNTVFTGVPVGGVRSLSPGSYEPKLSLANFSPSARHVSVNYYVAGQTTHVVTTTVEAMRVITLPLHALQGSSTLEDSIKVESDGAPGDVSASLVSIGSGSLAYIQILGKDQVDQFNSGQHPWALDNGSESTLLLYNHESTSNNVWVQLDAAGVSWIKQFTLTANQTRAFDIRTLIEEREPDDRGHIIPREAGVGFGEISWNAGGPGLVSGRLLEVNKSLGMARSFSCGAYTYLCGALSFLPGGIDVGNVGAGGVTGLDGCQSVSRCSNGEVTFRKPLVKYDWGTADTSIASLTGPTNSKNASFYGSYPGMTSSYSRVCDGYGCCVGNTKPLPVNPKVAISGPRLVLVSGAGDPASNTITLTASGTPSNGTYTWSQNGSLSLSSTSGQTINVSGSSGARVTLTVTYRVNGQSANANQEITVQQPSSNPVVSDIASHPSSCSPGLGGWYRDTNRQLLDQFGDPILVAGLQIDEMFTVASNGLGIKASDIQTGTGFTNSSGLSRDTFGFCSSACPTSATAPAQQSETQLQYSLGTYQVTYACGSITVQ